MKTILIILSFICLSVHGQIKPIDWHQTNLGRSISVSEVKDKLNEVLYEVNKISLVLERDTIKPLWQQKYPDALPLPWIEYHDNSYIKYHDSSYIKPYTETIYIYEKDKTHYGSMLALFSTFLIVNNMDNYNNSQRFATFLAGGIISTIIFFIEEKK